MKRSEFFKNALRARKYKEKNWIISAFSIQRKSSESNEQQAKPWYIYQQVNDDGIVEDILFTGEDGQYITIDDYEYNSDKKNPPFQFLESINISSDEVENLTEDEITTSYGTLLVNYLVLIEPFGSKIEYKNGRVDIKDIEKDIVNLLTSSVEDPSQRDENLIYPDEYDIYRKAAMYLTGFTQLCVPSASEKMLTTHPDVPKRRQELIEEYKDRLDDPTIIHYIEQELKKLDKEHLEGDVSEGFLIKGKTLDPARKKAHLMMGIEEGFDDADTKAIVTQSLAEGIDPKDLPGLINSLREGSYDRGFQTMNGGRVAKALFRIMQNSKIEEEDCGSNITLDTFIKPNEKDRYVGNFILVNNEVVEITNENIDKYTGTTVNLRTPLFCKTEGNGFCLTCMGKRFEGHERSLASAASQIGTTFMMIFMKSIHGKALETAEYNPIDRLQ